MQTPFDNILFLGQMHFPFFIFPPLHLSFGLYGLLVPESGVGGSGSPGLKISGSRSRKCDSGSPGLKIPGSGSGSPTLRIPGSESRMPDSIIATSGLGIPGLVVPGSVVAGSTLNTNDINNKNSNSLFIFMIIKI